MSLPLKKEIHDYKKKKRTNKFTICNQFSYVRSSKKTPNIIASFDSIPRDIQFGNSIGFVDALE